MRETVDFSVDPTAGSDYAIYHPSSCGTKHAIRESVKDCLKRKFGYLSDLSVVVDSHGELVLFTFNGEVDQCGTMVPIYISGQATPDSLIVKRIKVSYLGNSFDLDTNMNCTTHNFDVLSKALFSNLMEGQTNVSLNSVPVDEASLKKLFKAVEKTDSGWRCSGTSMTPNQVIKKFQGYLVDFDKELDVYTITKE